MQPSSIAESGSTIPPELAEFVFGENPSKNSPKFEPLGEQPGSSSQDLTILFCGDLARNIQDDELRAVFQPYGEIVSIDIKRDMITHNNLGYGFVTFKTREQAALAMSECNGKDVGGRSLRIGWAQKNTTLSIANLEPTVDLETIKDAFKVYGPIIEEDSFIRYGDVTHIRYKNRGDAEAAKAALNQHVFGSSPIRIGWADQVIRKNCIFLQFDAKHARQLSEARLLKRLNEFGPVASLNLPRDHTNNRLKGYAFVHYAETEEGEQQAAAAIETLTRLGKVDNLHVRCNYARRQGWKGVETSSPSMEGFQRKFSGHLNEHSSFGGHGKSNGGFGGSRHNSSIYNMRSPPASAGGASGLSSLNLAGLRASAMGADLSGLNPAFHGLSTGNQPALAAALQSSLSSYPLNSLHTSSGLSQWTQEDLEQQIRALQLQTQRQALANVASSFPQSQYGLDVDTKSSFLNPRLQHLTLLQQHQLQQQQQQQQLHALSVAPRPELQVASGFPLDMF